jgi:invasion protein IalB
LRIEESGCGFAACIAFEIELVELKMLKTSIGTLALAVALVAAPATSFAQTPKPIKQHKAWGAYSYKDARAGTICYILSIPTKPDGSAAFEPQVEVGYPLKADASVTVTVDGKSFKMFSQGNNAWLTDVSQESTLVAAMKNGRSMKVSGQSTRGTQTSYTYSLSGVTAALNEVTKCR